ncbi:MAG: PIN domain-containing protein [Cyanobacteriota bacterium]
MPSSTQKIKRIFVDTNFLSSLLKSSDSLNNQALDWLEKIKIDNSKTYFYLSTITIAEYCRFGDREDIPNYFQIFPFDDESAELSADFSKIIFPNKSTLNHYISLPKNIITNDIKIIAHAEIIKPDIFLSSDQGLESIFKILKTDSKLTYKFYNFKNPYRSF